MLYWSSTHRDLPACLLSAGGIKGVCHYTLQTPLLGEKQHSGEGSSPSPESEHVANLQRMWKQAGPTQDCYLHTGTHDFQRTEVCWASHSGAKQPAPVTTKDSFSGDTGFLFTDYQEGIGHEEKVFCRCKLCPGRVWQAA